MRKEGDKTSPEPGQPAMCSEYWPNPLVASPHKVEPSPSEHVCKPSCHNPCLLDTRNPWKHEAAPLTPHGQCILDRFRVAIHSVRPLSGGTIADPFKWMANVACKILEEVLMTPDTLRQAEAAPPSSPLAQPPTDTISTLQFWRNWQKRNNERHHTDWPVRLLNDYAEFLGEALASPYKDSPLKLRHTCGDPASELIEQYCAACEDLPLPDWVLERYENCIRLAGEKTGLDRDGWLNDADYFRQIGERLSSNFAKKLAASPHKDEPSPPGYPKDALSAPGYSRDEPSREACQYPNCGLPRSAEVHNIVQCLPEDHQFVPGGEQFMSAEEFYRSPLWAGGTFAGKDYIFVFAEAYLAEYRSHILRSRDVG